MCKSFLAGLSDCHVHELERRVGRRGKDCFAVCLLVLYVCRKPGVILVWGSGGMAHWPCFATSAACRVVKQEVDKMQEVAN